VSFRLQTNIAGGNMPPRRPGTVIKKLRQARDLTQEQLAKRAGISQAYLSQLEAGEKKYPSLPTLKKLAKALDVTVVELLE
jgi:transcriptional regulator with XRE-family HTH domain